MWSNVIFQFEGNGILSNNDDQPVIPIGCYRQGKDHHRCQKRNWLLKINLMPFQIPCLSTPGCYSIRRCDIPI